MVNPKTPNPKNPNMDESTEQHVLQILSAFQSEQHISDADGVLAHQDAKAAASGAATGEEEEREPPR